MSESQMQWKLNLTYTVFAFTAVTTVARLYTRGCLLRQLGLEDALIAFAVLGDFALVFVNRPSTIELTRLVADLIRNRNSPLVVVARAGKISFAIKMSFVTAIIYPVVFGSIKLSILAFYCRFITSRALRYVIYVLASCTMAFTLSSILVLVCQCIPTHRFWAILSKDPCHLEPSIRLQLANSIFNLITDVLILLLPHKCGLTTPSRSEEESRPRFRLPDRHSRDCCYDCTIGEGRLLVSRDSPFAIDNLLATIDLGLWTQVEVNLVAICANSSSLAALLKAFRERYGKSLSSTRFSRSTPISMELREQRGSGMVTSVSGKAPSSSQEHIVPKPAGIFRSTRVVMDVESAQNQVPIQWR